MRHGISLAKLSMIQGVSEQVIQTLHWSRPIALVTFPRVCHQKVSADCTMLKLMQGIECHTNLKSPVHGKWHIVLTPHEGHYWTRSGSQFELRQLLCVTRLWPPSDLTIWTLILLGQLCLYCCLNSLIITLGKICFTSLHGTLSVGRFWFVSLY